MHSTKVSQWSYDRYCVKESPMQWLLVPIMIFLALVALGRAQKAGLLRKGPFVLDGPVLRSVLVYVLSAAGIGMGLKGQLIAALVFFLLALIVGSAARFRFMGDQIKSSYANSLTDEDHKAFELLNLKPTKQKSVIEKAYRQAMKKAHPDLGGPEEQAKKLNWARDHLLKRIGG